MHSMLPKLLIFWFISFLIAIIMANVRRRNVLRYAQFYEAFLKTHS